jgi:hypothetical protein
MTRHLRVPSSCALLALLGVMFAVGCSDDARNPFTGGYIGPGTPGMKQDAAAAATGSDARALDGARLDVSSSMMSVGGAAGSGTGGGGGGGGGSTGSGGTAGANPDGGAGNPTRDAGGRDLLWGWYDEERCRQCEMNNCTMYKPIPTDPREPKDRYTPCIIAKDVDGKELKVDKGPRAGSTVQALCEDLLLCIRESGCAKGGVAAACLCGSATADECRSDETKANGPCKDLAKAAAHLEDLSRLDLASLRFFDESYTSGKATQLILCDVRKCGEECLNLPPPDGGTAQPDAEPTGTSPDGDATPAPDGPAATETDASVDAAGDAGATDADVDGGDAGAKLVQTLACRQCAETNKDNGKAECQGISSCDKITNAADRALCETLYDCMFSTACWQGAGGARDCYCGTATGLTCTSAPTGVCVQQALAAAKIPATDPDKYLKGSSFFFNTTLPSGIASKLLNCEFKANNPVCLAECTKKVPQGSETTPDAGPDAAPDVAPDAAPDAEPDVAPDVGPDAPPDVQPDLAPDMSLMPDLPPPPDTAPGVEMCLLDCRASRRGAPLPAGCNPLMGCENLTGADRTKCENLRACLYANPTCWQEGNVAKCYCGTAAGLDCNSMPNGPCVQQALAAADLQPTDYNNGSIRYFSTLYPSGHATQEVLCNVKCLANECSGTPPDAAPDMSEEPGTGGSGGDGGSSGTGGSGTGGSGTGGSGTGGSGTGGSGTGGSGTGGSGTGGSGTGGSGTGGTGTGGGSGGPCADLDNNGVSDCTESVMANSNFASDIASWNLPVTVTAQWVANGAQGAPTGAIQANNVQFSAGGTQTVFSGPEQCVPATPGNYKMYAQTFIATGDGPGFVALNVLFYKGAGCTSTFLGAFQPATVSVRDVWTTIQGTAIVPAETTSMRVRLGLIKSVGEPSFKATFDNVLIAPTP